MAIRKSTSNNRPVRKAAAPVAALRPITPAKPRASGEPAPEVAKSKPKVVRDSFSFSKSEYAELGELKKRAAHLRRPAKKSEILRAGIGALKAMSDAAFLATLNGVPDLKVARSKNKKVAEDSADPGKAQA